MRGLLTNLQKLIKDNETTGGAAARPWHQLIHEDSEIRRMTGELAAWWIIYNKPDTGYTLHELAHCAIAGGSVAQIAINLKNRHYRALDISALSRTAAIVSRGYQQLCRLDERTRSGADCTGHTSAWDLSLGDHATQDPPRSQHRPETDGAPAHSPVRGGRSDRATSQLQGQNRAPSADLKQITLSNGRVIALPSLQEMRNAVISAKLCTFCGGQDHVCPPNRTISGCGKAKLDGYDPKCKWAAAWAKATGA